jgi:type II secretory pathway component HofQ
MTPRTSRRCGHSVKKWLLVALLLPLAGVVSAAPASMRLERVTVAEEPDAAVVRITTSSTPRYHASLIDTPYRVVVDFEDAVYAWRTTPLDTDVGHVRQIRGSQYRKGIARVVVELKRKMAFEVQEQPDGLVLVIRAAVATVVAPPAEPAASGALAAGRTPTARPIVPALPTTGAEAPAGPPPGADVPSVILGQVTAPPPPTPAPSAPPPAAPSAQLPAPQPPPAASERPANNQRPISLDFKEADVVNLLRILAAESGRNIVIGDDVKGKMSISLRNVPWELALDTILEARGLTRIERDGVIRIVSNEQLAREREAKARVEEAKLKSEAEVRAKIAEAQVKEAEALTRKLQAEVAQKEQEAKGPLREETIRLSYADPEEVAKTLQGILGIPAEGAKVTGPGFLGIPGPPGTAPNPELGIPYSGPPPPPQNGGVVSVSQEVLSKGLTIRAHKPTNTLFLRLYASDLERVKKIIRESLDIPLPQVKIEARMEILDRNALEAIGVMWGGFFANNAGSNILVGQGLQTTVGPGGQTVPIVPGIQQGPNNLIDLLPLGAGAFSPGNNPFFLGPNRNNDATRGLPVSFQTGLPAGGNLVNLPINTLPNTAGALPAAGLSFGIIGSRFNVNLALQALATQGKTRTLARPEVVTVENNKASISLGEELPYATISSAGTQIQFKEALLKLDVTPTVIKEGAVTRIKLVVIVENNSRGDTVNLGGAGSPPAINRRRAETQVLIKEGDRLIIGGVTTGVNQATTRKVPVFGDIPILGYLFRQKENFESGRELVVFLTPTIVRGPESGPAVVSPAPPFPPPTPAPSPAPTR